MNEEVTQKSVGSAPGSVPGPIPSPINGQADGKAGEKIGWLSGIENSFSILVLAAMSLLPLIEIAARQVLGRGIPGSIPIVQHLTLWSAFLGAALAARSDRLLALSTASFLPHRFRRVVQVAVAGLGIVITVWLLSASWDLVRIEREAGEMVAWGIPVWVALLIMPIGFALIVGRLIWRSARSWRGRLLAAAALAVPAAFELFPSLQEADFLRFGISIILVGTALGLPIYAALGGAAMLLFWNYGTPLTLVPNEAYRISASPMLPAIPLFTLGGFILAEGGASRRLIRTFRALIGWMPGGMAVATTLVLAFFTPFTGASGVTILSMGGLLLPVLTKSKYPEKTSVGLVTVSGSIGLLFPPSLPVILYAIYAKQSIDSMFIGGLLPGIILVMGVAAWGANRGWKAGAPRTAFNAREAGAALWEAKWELLLPVVVLVGIFGGFATLVEAAALTVLYSFIVEVFVYKDLRVFADLPRIVVESATLTGGFLIILGMALGFTNYLVYDEIPMRALHWVQAHIDSPIVFLLALNLFLIIVGALMDIYSAILVVVPLITPIGAAYGIHPVHLGIIFLANMELGYLMPPMGENLFLASYRFKQSLTRVYLSTGPYLLILLAAVLLITYVPSLTLGLLHLMGR